MSKMTKKKVDKQRRRTKALRRKRNIERNMRDPVWRLDVLLEGKWYTAKRYRRREQVDAHMADTEQRRKAGEVIVPGKVILIATGQVIQEIEPSGDQPLTAKGPMDAKKMEPVSKSKKGVLGKIFGKKEVKERIPKGASQ